MHLATAVMLEQAILTRVCLTLEWPLFSLNQPRFHLFTNTPVQIQNALLMLSYTTRERLVPHHARVCL
jgi:hypothetical protein